MDQYTLPVQAQQPETETTTGVWGRLRSAFIAEHQTRLLQHALHQTTDEEKVRNLFTRVGLDVQEGFVQDEVLLFNFSAWKNSLTIPEVVVQRRVEEGVRREETVGSAEAPAALNNLNAAARGAAGRLAGLVGRLVGAGGAAEPARTAAYSGGDP